MHKALNSLTLSIDIAISDLKAFFAERRYVVLALVIVTILAYGFELFNFNLTIDEEVHAFSMAPSVWITQGRWGMYLLNKFILPYTVVPVIPLFLALLFHISAVILLLCSWGVESKIEQMIIGSVCIAYPGIAYMYTFSTISYGIGIGLFSSALSLWFFERAGGSRKLLAVFPAAFAISIYQGFTVALACIYLASFIAKQMRAVQQPVKSLFSMMLTLIIAALFYYLVHKLLTTYAIPESTYVSSFFEVNYLKTHFRTVIDKLLALFVNIYTGDAAIYGQKISVLLALMVISFCGIAINIFLSTIPTLNKIVLLIFSLILVVLPFATGLLTRGNIPIRSLVALPIVISGVIAIGIRVKFKLFRAFILCLSIFCIFQFSISTNRLFASSHLALQADRLIAANLIERIEEAKFVAESDDIKYLELIGYLDRKPTKLMPRTEGFGASFFDWDSGNVGRVVLFLKTIGYQGISGLPIERRGAFIGQADAMPSWPQVGSVKVIGDTVLVKFGPYSYRQKDQICKYNQSQPIEEITMFCE